MNTIILKKLVAKYLVAAMTTWVSFSSQLARDHQGHWVRDDKGSYVKEDEASVKARYEADAERIVDVTYDDTLKPIFRGEEGRLKTALLLGAIASLEGGFHEWVENGDCNQAGWLGGGCDGGHAYSIFQIHVYDYMIKDGVLTQSRYVDKEYREAHQDEIIKGQTLIDDPYKAVLVAYYLALNSMTTYHSLCAYSGESCTGNHPKATQRLDRAQDYLRTHPFVLPSAEELELMEAEENVN